MGQISESIRQIINEQISHEMYNAQLYFKISSYLKSIGLDNIGNFFEEQGKGEQEHAEKFRNYLNDRNVEIDLLQVPAVEIDFNSIVEIGKKYIFQEQLTTEKIINIAKIAFEEGDLMTFNVIQWFINEQIEEENIAQTFLDKANMIGEDKLALVLWDDTYEK